MIKKGQSLFSEQDPELAWDDVKISFTSAYKRRLKEQLKSIQQSCIPFSNRLFSQFVLQNYDSDIPLFSCNLAFMAEVSPKGVHAIAQTRIFLTDVLIAKILVKIKKLEPAAQSHLYALMHAIKTLHQEAGRCFDFGTYKLLHMMEAFIQYDKFNITSFKKAVLNYKALATLLYDPALENNWGNLVAKARDLDALLLQSEIRADFVKSPADQDFDNLFLQLPAEAPQESLLLSERRSDLKTENLMQGREANGFFKAKDPDSESFHSTRPESAGHQTG